MDTDSGRCLSAMTVAEQEIVTYLKRCAELSVGSRSAFNQGVTRGMEIAAAQIEHLHHRAPPEHPLARVAAIDEELGLYDDGDRVPLAQPKHIGSE